MPSPGEICQPVIHGHWIALATKRYPEFLSFFKEKIVLPLSSLNQSLLLNRISKLNFQNNLIKNRLHHQFRWKRVYKPIAFAMSFKEFQNFPTAVLQSTVRVIGQLKHLTKKKKKISHPKKRNRALVIWSGCRKSLAGASSNTQVARAQGYQGDTPRSHRCPVMLYCRARKLWCTCPTQVRPTGRLSLLPLLRLLVFSFFFPSIVQSVGVSFFKWNVVDVAVLFSMSLQKIDAIYF